MVLLLDNFDSFTYNLVDYFGQLGIETKVLRNHTALSEIKSCEYRGIVLGPGPETPSKAGNLMQVIEAYLGQMPMLGICLGHQAIGQYLGARLVKAPKPMHGKVSTICTLPGKLFEGLPSQFEVVRYHSLILEALPAALKATAFTTDESLMAFEEPEGRVFGIQFHPEAALTEHGLHILNNWAKFSGIV